MARNHDASTGRRRLRCAAWFILALALIAVRAGAQEGAVVDSLRYEGLVAVDPDLLTDALRIHPGETITQARISRTVEGLYALGLFDQVSAETVQENGKTILIFHFRERPQVADITYSGNKHFSAEDLREYVPFKGGEVLRRADLDAARRNIEEAYRKAGYPNARVIPQAGQGGPGQKVPVVFEIEEGEQLTVRAVHFEGAHAFSEDELRGEISTHTKNFWLLRKGHLSPDKLTADVTALESFYRNHGFRDATVRLKDVVEGKNGESAEITFEITEGQQYFFTKPKWTGVAALDTDRLEALTAFTAGEAFDQSKIDATVATAADLYTERGYFVDLRIDPETEVRGDSVAITFAVQEGPPSRVGDLRIVGNTRTREYVIRRELGLYPGDLMRRSALLRAQRDVFATGFFEDVTVEFEPQPESDEVDVVFRVKEKSAATASAGAGYSSQVGLTGFVQFGHNNLLGRGQTISLRLERGSRTEDYDVSFTEPWVWGRPISVGFDVYSTESQREVFASGGDETYWQRLWGGGLRFGLPWLMRERTYTRMSFGYSLSETRYRDYSGLPEETQDLLLEGAGKVSRFFVALGRNSTDNPFHPTLGTASTWRTEFNGGPLGGDMDYVRMSFDHRQYFAPIWKPVLMLRWRAGVLSGSHMPPAERFRLGGTMGFDMLRGYDDLYVVPEDNITRDSAGNEVRFPGGRYMFGFTAELQFPIVDPVYGALFLDAGDTWNSFYDISLGGLKYGLGAGVTLEIPMLGPVGFYYAYGAQTGEWKTHFAFGTQL